MQIRVCACVHALTAKKDRKGDIVWEKRREKESHVALKIKNIYFDKSTFPHSKNNLHSKMFPESFEKTVHYK